MQTPNAAALYTATIFQHSQRYLLLQRAPTKRLAPNRWTGIGGRVEPQELNDLRAAALRELREETRLTEADIANFTLRRVLFHNRRNEPITTLLYFTGVLAEALTPDCTEGVLRWMTPEEMSEVDIIETTRLTLPLLIQDLARDPLGQEPVRLGLADYRRHRLENILWTTAWMEKDGDEHSSDGV